MKPNTFTIKLWLYTRDNGIARATTQFFNTESEARQQHRWDEAECWTCSEVYPTTLAFDLTTGQLIED